MSDSPPSVLILAGGYGTRMRPLTFTRSKPLIEFCNVPLIQYLLDASLKVKCKSIIVSINKCHHDVVLFVKQYSEKHPEVEIHFSIEDEESGTAGAIFKAKDFIGTNRFIVLSCGCLTSFPLAELIDFHIKHKSEATLLSARVEDCFFLNVIEEDEHGTITAFNDKPSSKKKNCLVHAGCAIFEPEFINRITDEHCELGNDLLSKLIPENKIFAYEHPGVYINFAEMQDLISGISYYAKDKSVVVDSTAKVDSTAQLGDCVVIGPNCVIGPNTKLDHCVIYSSSSIGSNCVINNSIIGWKNKIGDNVIITDMSVLAEKVTVHSDTELSQFYISPYKTVNASNAFITLAKVII
ncbi:Nucleotidyl transferase family protein [Trichomonas vaginalis G3]|uniref:Nucleotidyl transferase family protein n=1 Tax=Trichomonas vaginalis (strain ATCC PRA-98 / G3) TaxID=412133 RepID=A2G1C4_TRIV3|nr:mannose-1-phosphate guanylyltransferase protein [Trichomonas vaginalis G3]EAX89040.1 Nucleotidyl transferase family protein [Trichomonas vaginalis G3]KAI5513146.1 mannose-1-phosphate guanylyltransferase protein [Trichomonas vaginalis G3]|eukprot:XP_001301970.1 Nucleotidyl transferase family protein [Trichomonas vaginalis G3]